MTLRHVLFAVLIVSLAGCAGPEKLARRSQEQLAAGDPRKAYETALKAVQKDPFHAAAQVALRDAGDALLVHDLRRLRTLAGATDSLAAAEVALEMDRLRREVADFGVTLTNPTRSAEDERAVRRAASSALAREGDAHFDAGETKAACHAYARAAEYDPEDIALQDQLRVARTEATDQVLLFPYAFETRASLDGRRLSWDMYRDISRFADGRLEFTQLIEPGELWGRAFGLGGEWTREAAYEAGRDRSATRVAWARISGDRVESRIETFDAIVYRQVTTATPEGGTSTRWLEVPVRVRIEDVWTSVGVECEVHEVEPRRLVTRRESERGTGRRSVTVIGDMLGAPEHYALYTPDMWRGDRKGCESRRARWAESLGDLSVEALVARTRSTARRGGVEASSAYGSIERGGRSYRIAYGRRPAESVLLESAVAEAWRDVAATLEEADRL